MPEEADHGRVLAEIKRPFDDEPEPGTPESARFDALADAIERCEGRVP